MRIFTRTKKAESQPERYDGYRHSDFSRIAFFQATVEKEIESDFASGKIDLAEYREHYAALTAALLKARGLDPLGRHSFVVTTTNLRAVYNEYLQHDLWR